jgi:hypothetical protein
MGLLAACGTPRPAHPVPIAVLVDGDPAALATLPSVDGLELRRITAPASAAPPDGTVAELAQARAAYAGGDPDTCRAAVAKLDLVQLLARRERLAVARALVLDAACAWAGADKTAARATAARLATFGLELPEISISPDVERALGDAVVTVGRAKRVALAIDGVVGGRVILDGRDAGCTLPCSVDVAPGDHVVAVETDGYEPAAQLVRVDAARALKIDQQPASPPLAAAQWQARVGRGFPAVDVVGAALIGRFAGEARVAWLHADRTLDGALVVDGKTVARAQRDAGQSGPLLRELAYEGRVLPRPTVWQKPTTWIWISAAVLAVAGGIIYAVYEPDPRTRVVLSP